MNYVLACTRDDTLRIVDLRMNQLVQSYQAEGFRAGTDTTRPCFSPDGCYIAVGSQDCGVYIWNVRSGQLETCLREHSGVVTCCHWHPQAHSLISCERLKQAIIWADC
ncbi:unnamed protein product [Protopolystoma xenopodis]|uniref:Uncharacterized protein n=1 Tax=Protopolystoma xenopodis TaxID=117903 RepID=A0A448X4I3_9PLAT|nr:unnamed protein product [Protopolystoma xenopodis]